MKLSFYRRSACLVALLPALAVSAQQQPAATPSTTADLQSVIPTGTLPPPQEHCTSPIYCPGPLLQAVQLAAIFEDSKTFVDKATSRPEADVVAAFQALGDGQGGNVTYAQIIAFVNDNFAPEGEELVPADLGDEFVESPAFLDRVDDAVVRDWMRQVHSYWELLARTTNQTSPSGVQCEGCVSSFVPFNERRTFVIPGGRFRELYYWDTYFVIAGLIKSELPSVVKAILENFGDLVERLGFVPNGNRLYYENRSQPPFLALMVGQYISAYNDTAILTRFLPLLEREMAWWATNRTSPFTSPYTQRTYNLTRYAVDTSAPRPESYLEDFETVEMANESGLELNDTQKARLYSDLASGAESGNDYSASRWSTRPTIDLNDTIPAQRFLNTQAQLPVDLNSILFLAEQKLAAFYRMPINGSRARTNETRSTYWAQQAAQRRDAILDVFWDPTRRFFYDFNTTAGDRSPLYSAAGFFPLWARILPTEFLNETVSLAQRREAMQGVFAGLRFLLDRYNGSVPASVLLTGQQWDLPNAWPPHAYIAVEALRGVPEMLANGTALPAPNGTYALIPSLSFGGSNTVNQLGQTADALPAQPVDNQPGATLARPDAGATAPNNGTLHLDPPANVGNETTTESWRDELLRSVANRYVASALCSWRATGGRLNTTDPAFQPVPSDVLRANGLNGSSTGNMFEKFSTFDVNAAGGGGEYEVVTGFGWTNGVALWMGGELGGLLVRPDCPEVVANNDTASAGV